MSTLKVDTITTISGTGNINLSRPIAGDGSNLTGVAPTKTTVEALGIDVPAANLTGTIAGARLPDPLPAISGASLTGVAPTKATVEALGIDLPAANLTGTIADARLPDPLPAIDGSSLTGISTTPNRPYFNYVVNGYIQFNPGVWHKLNYTSGAQQDSNSAFDSANDKFVVPTGHAGVYYLEGGVCAYTSVNTLDNVSLNIRVNGSSANGAGATRSSISLSGRRRESLTIGRMATLAVGDYIELYFYGSGAGGIALNLDATTQNGAYFLGWKII